MKKFSFLTKTVVLGASFVALSSGAFAEEAAFDTGVQDRQDALKGGADMAQLEVQIKNYERNVDDLLNLKETVYKEVAKLLPTADRGNEALIKELLEHEPTFIQFLDFIGDYTKNIAKEINELKIRGEKGELTNQNLLEFASVVGTTFTTISQFVNNVLMAKVKEENPAFLFKGLSEKHTFKCPTELTKDQWKKLRDNPSSSITVQSVSFTLYKGAENFPLSTQLVSWKKLASPDAFVKGLYDPKRLSLQCEYMYKSATTHKPYNFLIEHKL